MDAVYKALRERRVFIYELARQIQISETRLRRILKGRVSARPDELKRIARALSLDVEVLVRQVNPDSRRTTGTAASKGGAARG